MATVRGLTPGQNNLISDIEKAASYFESTNGRPKNISDLVQAAGHDRVYFYNILGRMRRAGKDEGLRRIKSALERVGLKSDLLSHVKVQRTPKALASKDEPQPTHNVEYREIPLDSPVRQTTPLNTERGALFTILEILDQVPSIQRDRIIASAQMFYGIGE